MPHFRLLTANLWNGRAEPSAIADVLGRYEPDAALLQELAPAQAAAIERLMPHGLLMPRTDTRGMGLALRAPAAVSRLPLPGRDALAVRIAPSQGPFSEALEIINVHVSAPTALSRFPLRRAQLRLLHAHLARLPMRRVVAGDLNSFRLMPAYRCLRRSLRDAALSRGARPRPTWGPGADFPRLLRLDHVLTSGLEVVDLEVIAVRGSDHSAVLATLAMG
jgi:endonuclease/exonuclease/phosphatase family metal-dependent hydrolase